MCHRFDELVLHGIMDLTIYYLEIIPISSGTCAVWFLNYRAVRQRSPRTEAMPSTAAACYLVQLAFGVGVLFDSAIAFNLTLAALFALWF